MGTGSREDEYKESTIEEVEQIIRKLNIRKGSERTELQTV